MVRGLVTIHFWSKVETNYRCCELLELCFSVNRAHCQKNNVNISKVLRNFVIVCLLINLLGDKVSVFLFDLELIMYTMLACLSFPNIVITGL